MDSLLRDMRHALAQFARDRRFAAAALVTLALGIGATTAVFSIVYGVLLRPLPYPSSSDLVRVYEEHPGAPRPPGDPPLSNTTMYAWRDRLQTLEGLAAYYGREYTMMVGGEAVRIHGAEASPSLFALLGVKAELGRFYVVGEDAPNANRFAVIADRLWREQFGGRSDAIGASIVLDGKPHVIVGVAPPDFHFPDHDARVWTPYDDPTLTDPSVQGGMWLAPSLGRLKPGASLAQAAAEGTTAARAVKRPASATVLFGNGGPVQVRVERLADLMTERVRPALVLLSVSVVFVLLIGCTNVANLFLSRGVSRTRELAVRAALGASRRQLVRQLLAESVVLAGLGGAVGLVLAWALMRALPLGAPASFPRLDAIRLDPITVACAVAASLAAAIVSGLAPALRGARVDLAVALHPGDGGQAGSSGGGARRLRDGLLIAESALATLLLVGAALLGRSFAKLTDVDPGYDPANVMVARVYTSPGTTGAQSMRFIDALLSRLRESPQVVAAGAGNMMPFSDSTWITAFPLPSSAGAGKAERARTLTYLVTPGYAAALGLRLREGRPLEASDAVQSPLRILVNREFVRQYLQGGSTAGRTFAGGPYKAAQFEIVGVVDDVLKDGNDARPKPEIYSMAMATRPIEDEVNIVMRMAGDPAAGAAILRAAVRDLDRGAAIGELMPLTARVSASVAQPRFAMAVVGAFAALALLLASVGVYGMLSYTVARRARELGVRAALGAGRGQLVQLVLRDGMTRVVCGLLAGAGLAAALTPLMRGLLFGITPLDVIAYAVAPALLVPVAIAACLGPARRAATSDPAAVLRGS